MLMFSDRKISEVEEEKDLRVLGSRKYMHISEEIETEAEAEKEKWRKRNTLMRRMLVAAS